MYKLETILKLNLNFPSYFSATFPIIDQEPCWCLSNSNVDDIGANVCSKVGVWSNPSMLLPCNKMEFSPIVTAPKVLSNFGMMILANLPGLKYFFHCGFISETTKSKIPFPSVILNFSSVIASLIWKLMENLVKFRLLLQEWFKVIV